MRKFQKSTESYLESLFLKSKRAKISTENRLIPQPHCSTLRQSDLLFVQKMKKKKMYDKVMQAQHEHFES